MLEMGNKKWTTMGKRNSDWKSIDWQYLYRCIVKENSKLKKQVEVLESILRTHLPIIGEDK